MDSPDHLRSIERTPRPATVASAALLVAWLLRDVLLLGFASVLMACALHLASSWLGRVAGTGPKMSLLIVVAALAAITVSFAWWHGPVVIGEAGNLAGQLRASLRRGWERLAEVGWWPQARCGTRRRRRSAVSAAT